MSSEHSSRPPLSKVAAVTVAGILLGTVLAFPAVSRILRSVLGTLGGLGTTGLFVVVGSVAIVSIMLGLFVVWRMVQGA